MNLERTIALVLPGAGDHVDVPGHLLGRRRTAEEADEECEVSLPRQDLLDSHERDMNVGSGCREAVVAFVFDEDEPARFGDRKVDAANSDMSFAKVGSELCASLHRQLVRILSVGEI